MKISAGLVLDLILLMLSGDNVKVLMQPVI